MLSLEAFAPWSFGADAAELKLASEARRITLASHFDPYLAVRTSNVQPLPHQISAVYGEMLPRLPLRYVLADDPGAGKTVMTGLLIKEMILRGDLARCLIVCPGSLCEQWQDELLSKFGLRFDILTNDRLEAYATRNAFTEMPFVIARLDKLARDGAVQEMLRQVSWDLVVCDEAHKMSASLTGGEVKATKRYRLGQLLGKITENLLLLTATPHNGKPGDFQLFMALIDPDRFEGAKRAMNETVDVSDCMRRLVKEELLTFEGKPLFPERRAYTVNYELSPAEAELYRFVTEYVKNEFNRADRLDGKRRQSVGFALTMLQRRVASSPEAIYQSLRRRRERLSDRLAEVRGASPDFRWARPHTGLDRWADVSGDGFDEDDIPLDELEELEEDITDTASAAETVQELEAEIAVLTRLEGLADRVRLSGADRKWEELSSLLQDDSNMFTAQGSREKLIVFTEHKDTLHYLYGKLVSLLGSREAVITIRGGMGRDARWAAERAFKQDQRVRILIATDAAGEGINLQRAHLMVNYDLPWNPNRLEQRFGRIHRIGQTEVCHLWNLVSAQTREGEVFQRLFSKLEEERRALGGRVFDILGRMTFDDAPLKDLLLDAVRYGEDPKVRAHLNEVVDRSFDAASIKRLLEEYALSEDTMDLADVLSIRRDMDRAEARKLEPHFIQSFFLAALAALGGRAAEREPGRYEVLRVPQNVLRCGDGCARGAVLRAYERVCFDRALEHVEGAPDADLMAPGHPLLEALAKCALEEYGGALEEGAFLVDDEDWSDEPRLLFYVESAVRDGVPDASGRPRTVSRELRFVELRPDGKGSSAGFAPYLDYRCPRPDELVALQGWLPGGPFGSDARDLAVGYAVSEVVPEHLERVSARRLAHVRKVRDVVAHRMRSEIRYWDGRAWELAEREREGKRAARLNAAQARQRADELNARMRERLDRLDAESRLAPAAPLIVGCSLVVPRGLMAELAGTPIDLGAKAGRDAVEAAGMAAVMAAERAQGFTPRDVSAQNVGYDVESCAEGAHDAAAGRLRLIEVKGRIAGSDTVTVSRNEVLCALNKPECFLLALVKVDFDEGGRVASTHTTYLSHPFVNRLDAAANCAVYQIRDLLRSGEVVYEREEAL